MSVRVRRGLLGETEQERLEAARKFLVPNDPLLRPVQSLRLGLYPGFAHDSVYENGAHAYRRVYVVGEGAVVLYASAFPEDPFPEAQRFFASLVVQPPFASRGAACVDPSASECQVPRQDVK